MELNSSSELESGPPGPLADLPPLLDDADAQPAPQGSGAPEADGGLAMPGEPTRRRAAGLPGVHQGWEPGTSSSQMAGHQARGAWQLPAAPWSSSHEVQSFGVAPGLSNPAQLPASSAPLPLSSCGGQQPGQLPPHQPEQPTSLLYSCGSAGSGGQQLQHAMLPASGGFGLPGLGHQQQAMLPCSGRFRLPEVQQQLPGPTSRGSAGVLQGLHEHQLAGPSYCEGVVPSQASHEQQQPILPTSSCGPLPANHGDQYLPPGSRHPNNRHHSGQHLPVSLPAGQALPQQPASGAALLHLALEPAGNQTQPRRAAQAAPAGHGDLWGPARGCRPQAHLPRHAEPVHAEPGSKEPDPEEGALCPPQSPQSEADLTPTRAAGLERELHQREVALRRWGNEPSLASLSVDCDQHQCLALPSPCSERLWHTLLAAQHCSTLLARHQGLHTERVQTSSGCCAAWSKQGVQILTMEPATNVCTPINLVTLSFALLDSKV